MKNAGPQGFHRAVWGQSGRRLKHLVEGAEGPLPVDEPDDSFWPLLRRPLSSAHPRGDVDDDEMRERGTTGRSHGDRRQPAERHAEQHTWVGWQAIEPSAYCGGIGGRAVVLILAPIGMSVSRQVNGDKGTVEDHSYGIPCMRVLAAAVQES